MLEALQSVMGRYTLTGTVKLTSPPRYSSWC